MDYAINGSKRMRSQAHADARMPDKHTYKETHTRARPNAGTQTFTRTHAHICTNTQAHTNTRKHSKRKHTNTEVHTQKSARERLYTHRGAQAHT